MGKIRFLPDILVNQIAAGEVVERPLSVLKELIENSIDAGSSEIIIELEKGGKEKIVIKDNGIGMEEEDIYMSLERHATSKIKNGKDLLSVKTMGFRGEAIPSIASVSHFSLASATSHGEGNKISVKGGKIVDMKPDSIPKGTEISVHRLFYNVPVRRKFLKSDEKEFALCREIIQKFAMLHPEIGFSLFHNERKIFIYPLRDSSFDRMLAIWKADKSDVREIESEHESTKIKLFLGMPIRTFSGSTLYSVNGRIVSDRKINAVIYKVTREMVGTTHRLTMALLIDIPHENVDVNVHPSKLEIRFRDERQVLMLVEESVRKGIASFRERSDLGSVVSDFNRDFKGNSSFQGGDHYQKSTPYERGNSSLSSGTPSYSTNSAAENKSFSYSDETVQQTTLKGMPHRGDDGAEIQNEQFNFDTRFKNYRVVGTVFSLYIVVEMGEKLYFIDQHASHERITYRRLLSLMEHKSGLSQMRIQAEIVKMSPLDMVTFTENAELFNDIGFVAEKFDEESVVIRGVPALNLETDWSLLMKDIIGELKEYSVSTAWEEKFLSFVATKACHSSIRYHDALKPEEIDALIEDINSSESLTCPHGRPFFHVIEKKEIEKRVLR